MQKSPMVFYIVLVYGTAHERQQCDTSYHRFLIPRTEPDTQISSYLTILSVTIAALHLPWSQGLRYTSATTSISTLAPSFANQEQPINVDTGYGSPTASPQRASTVLNSDRSVMKSRRLITLSSDEPAASRQALMFAIACFWRTICKPIGSQGAAGSMAKRSSPWKE